jgi:hypothetical protein
MSARKSVTPVPQGIGHNSADVSIRITARFFNSLARYSPGDSVEAAIDAPAGTTVGDLIKRFNLPLRDIFLVLRNGRDITPGLYQGGVVNETLVLDDGDDIAFSGPVPYSYGYGSAVC